MKLLHRPSAFLGTLFLVPFAFLNFIVAERVEPFYSFLSSTGVLSSKPWLPTFLILLFPISLFVTIRPMLRKDNTCGKHPIYIINILLGALILAATIFIWHGLGEDIIKCDILRIPNCD